jgi:hypothetical protein
LYGALAKAPVILARASLPSPPLSPMTKVYWLHWGWAVVLDPPNPVSLADEDEDEDELELHAARALVAASSATAAVTRGGLSRIDSLHFL